MIRRQGYPETREQPKTGRPASVRRRALIAIAVGLFGALLGLIGEALPQPLWAATAGVVVAISIMAIIAGAFTLLLAPDYESDRERVAAVWGFLRRPVTWSLAGGGLGALLASALPQRLASALSNPDAIPVAGWMAIVLAAGGLALGLLEDRLQADSRNH